MPSLKQLLATSTLLATDDNASTDTVRLDAGAPVRTDDAPDLHGTRARPPGDVRSDAVARSRVVPRARGAHRPHRALRPRRRS